MVLHGAKVYTLGVPPQEVLDYSNTLHPHGPPKDLIHAAQKGLRDTAFYPDLNLQGVNTGLAAWLGVSPAKVMPAHGVSEAVQLLTRSSRHEALLLKEEYGEYARELALADRNLHTVPVNLDAPDPAALIAAAKGREVWLSQPHNPTGRLFPQAALEELARRAAHLILDISLWFGAPRSLEDWLTFQSRHPKVTLLLSLTKAYACPGLRLGVVLSAPKRIQILRRLQNPWPLGQAEVAALNWITSRPLPPPPSVKDVNNLCVTLNRHGLVVLPGDAHYFLVRLPHRAGQTRALIQGLQAERILVKTVGNRYWRLRSLGPEKDGRFTAILGRLLVQG